MARPQTCPSLRVADSQLGALYSVASMSLLTDSRQLCEILDRELIGFLTAVNSDGQPQTSPVWYIRDGDDLVVYNKASTPRLDAVSANPKVSFNLRGDIRGSGAVTLEGVATVETLPQAKDFPGYVDKYRREIERMGWTPESFSGDYSVGMRIVVTRRRTWGLGKLSS